MSRLQDTIDIPVLPPPSFSTCFESNPNLCIELGPLTAFNWAPVTQTHSKFKWIARGLQPVYPGVEPETPLQTTPPKSTLLEVETTCSITHLHCQRTWRPESHLRKFLTAINPRYRSKHHSTLHDVATTLCAYITLRGCIDQGNAQVAVFQDLDLRTALGCHALWIGDLYPLVMRHFESSHMCVQNHYNLPYVSGPSVYGMRRNPQLGVSSPYRVISKDFRTFLVEHCQVNSHKLIFSDKELNTLLKRYLVKNRETFFPDKGNEKMALIKHSAFGKLLKCEAIHEQQMQIFLQKHVFHAIFKKNVTVTKNDKIRKIVAELRERKKFYAAYKYV